MILTDLRQSAEYAEFMRALGWQVERGAFIKKLPCLPWRVAKIQRQKKFNLPKATWVKIEPAWGDATDYRTLGFKPDKNGMLPRQTVWLDLTKSEKQLLTAMHPKTRYNIKKFKINNLQLTITLEEFYKIYHDNCRRQKFWGLNFNQLKCFINCFGNKARLLTTKEAGLLILIHDRVAYYSHNGATILGKKQFHPTLLIWQAILLAKKLGCKKFDFEGIDEKRWPGFTRFKLSWGGQAITYPTTYHRWQL